MTVISVEIPDDLTDLPAEAAVTLGDEISRVITQLLDVQSRLTVLTTAAAAVEALQSEYLDARDGTQPDTGQASDWPAYRQPTGAHDAYPAGRVIRWNDGHLYRAARSGVAHSPAEHPADWTDVTDELTGVDPPETPTAAEWSAAASYAVGDLVSRGGVVYRCLIAHGAEYAGTWGPPATGVWELVI